MLNMTLIREIALVMTMCLSNGECHDYELDSFDSIENCLFEAQHLRAASQDDNTLFFTCMMYDRD